MSAWTPGPWHINAAIGSVCAKVERGGSVVVSSIISTVGREDEVAGNAAVIAAAPELFTELEALREAAIALVGAVLSKDSRKMLIAANAVNTLCPSSGEALAKALGK